jgi:FkbM family methyltransferase
VPVAGWAKQLARSLLPFTGYRLLRTDTIGFDPLADLVRQYGDQLTMIFDVGANTGQSTVTFRKHFPAAEIHCFEPYPPAFDTARTLLGHDRRIYLHNHALGSDEATQTLFCHADSQLNSLLADAANATDYAPAEWFEPRGATTAQVRTLDWFCAERGITAVNLLKIDTQGYELQVLGGAAALLRRRAIQAIFCELLFVPYYKGQAFFEEVYSLLTGYGYRLAGLYHPTRGDTPPLYWCDGLFIL